MTGSTGSSVLLDSMQLTIDMNSMKQDGTHVFKQHCADLPAQPKHLAPSCQASP